MSTNAGGTIPPEILVTADRPDIVIIDKRMKTPGMTDTITIGHYRDF